MCFPNPSVCNSLQLWRLSSLNNVRSGTLRNYSENNCADHRPASISADWFWIGFWEPIRWKFHCMSALKVTGTHPYSELMFLYHPGTFGVLEDRLSSTFLSFGSVFSKPIHWNGVCGGVQNIFFDVDRIFGKFRKFYTKAIFFMLIGSFRMKWRHFYALGGELRSSPPNA